MASQNARIQKQRELCEIKMQQTEPPSNGSYCPMIWDELYCWPYVPAGELHSVPCPAYIQGVNTKAHATKFCTSIGDWWINPKTNNTWTNYSLCSIHDVEYTNAKLLEPHVHAIKLMSKIGYSLSLAALLVAFSILAGIKKLRCPRNSLHMQLFLSFIMRALMFLLKDTLFVYGVGFSSNMEFTNEGELVFLHSENNIDCKVFSSFWQYFLTANYCWILVEGLYLHNLIFRSMFTDTSGTGRYIILGWGMPAAVVIPWIIVRATLHDNLCWTTHKHAYFWIIRGPITISILINFFFFINISRVLFLKMFSTQAVQARRDRYSKWFKSTLILVPLFGVHYAIPLAISLSASVSRTGELVWLYIDQLFSASLGFFVALLYCFLNGEVQSEVKKLIQAQRANSYRSSHSFLTQSLTYLSRGRSSIQSLHSVTAEKRDGYQATSPKPFVSKREDRETGSVCLTSNTPLPSPRSSAGNSTNFHTEELKSLNPCTVELKLITNDSSYKDTESLQGDCDKKFQEIKGSNQTHSTPFLRGQNESCL